MNNLILSIIDNYNYFHVERFFNSLFKTGFEGHVCLFIGPNNDPALLKKLRKLKVELIPYQPKFPFIAHPHPANIKTLPDPIHIWNYRHFLYYDYLLHNGHKFDNVLLSDIKDVIFQQDPFAFPIADALHVAIENQTIAECSWTSGWLLAGYDEETLTTVKAERVTCAGTTLGPVEHVMRYLQTMLGAMATVKDVLNCADQAIQNVLLYTGALEPTVRLRNEAGIIMTVGTADISGYEYDAQGYLLNKQGTRVITIHQADRHPAMLQHLDKFTFKLPFMLAQLKKVYDSSPVIGRILRSLRSKLR